ncbi:MAG: tRNA (N6-isopentenyl adenosine(37)-C2)-methylthiotransferase MiaB [Clostridia bacterium]|nr:tRNA (N6-isopentenyl adenosine(37)-C2)-methylthiotransferase MiaB [Clostridia bacterium]
MSLSEVAHLSQLQLGKFEVSLDEIKRQREYVSLAKTVLESRFGGETPLAFVHTFGCQGNVSDSERMKGWLSQMGYGFTEVIEEADLVLYNTCAVREHAHDRVFGNVGALKPIKEKKPGMIIALCGCMMQQEHVWQKIRKSYPYVNLVFGTHALHRLPELMYKVLCGGKRVFEVENCDGYIAEGIPVRRDGSFKGWLPIMYGCNNFCSYCIVPYVRGRERSRSSEAVIAEARELIASGCKDITLLGQNVNSYNRDGGDMNFARLLEAINDIEGDFRIRFMTSHPKDCTFELLDTMARCEKVSKHLHLPFQSGNNRVLKEMNRGYTREKYLSLVEYARKVMPDISLTSDIIVGFPGETYEEFRDTVSLIEEVEFTSLFTFIYSPREGTKAASMPDPVSRKEKGEWFRELTLVQEKIASERCKKMLGQTYRVLCEDFTDGRLSGRTDGSVMIDFDGDESRVGEFVNVKVISCRNWTLSGEII